MDDQTRNPESNDVAARAPGAGGQGPTGGQEPTPPPAPYGQPTQPIGSAAPYNQPAQPQPMPQAAPYGQPAGQAGPGAGQTAYAPATAPAAGAATARRTNPIIWVLLALLVLLLACMAVAAAAGWFAIGSVVGQIPQAQVGELKTETQSVQLGTAQSVSATLTMNQGNLTLAGGSPNLLDATFTYNVPDWKPEVTYKESGVQGDLTVDVPGTDKISRTSGDARNDWDLRLNSGVPISLVANLGAGEGNLKLGDMNITKLGLNTGAGNTVVDLTGAWKQDMKGTIQAGVGQTTVRLPKDVGVSVTAKGGLGKVNANGLKASGDTYTNDAYGKSPVTLNIDVSVGVGEITLETAP